MVIVAHPDDADFGPAATAALWIDRGSVGRLVCCTSGDQGAEDAAMDPLALALTREAEQRRAAAIIGYDDVYIAGMLRVPLTTVHQAKYRMGQIAATGLVHILDGRQPAGGAQFLIKPRLIIRESCKEPSQ